MITPFLSPAVSKSRFFVIHVTYYASYVHVFERLLSKQHQAYRACMGGVPKKYVSVSPMGKVVISMKHMVVTHFLYVS